MSLSGDDSLHCYLFSYFARVFVLVHSLKVDGYIKLHDEKRKESGDAMRD